MYIALCPASSRKWDTYPTTRDEQFFISVLCSAGRPQPDNREGDEFCVAVLNNFYADGIRFHDVSCHHKKPVICEAR